MNDYSKILVIGVHRLLENKVKDLMSQRGDYPNYFAGSVTSGKYLRRRLQEEAEIEALRGEG